MPYRLTSRRCEGIMGQLIIDIPIETVSELKTLLSVIPDEMPTSDANGNPMRVRVYEQDGAKHLEVT